METYQEMFENADVELIEGKEIELPNSNLLLKAFKMDSNGNQTVVLSLINQKGFNIQTAGNLPDTHGLSKRGIKLKDLSDKDITAIETAVIDYIKKYRSAKQKSGLKTY